MPWDFKVNKIVQIVLFLAVTAMLVLFFVLEPGNNSLFPRCIFNSLTGYYCPGCGSQRAMHQLVHLNFAGVASNNFLFIPALIFIGYHYSYKLLNKKFGLKLPGLFYFKATPWIVFGIVVLFWILRNLPYYPFNVLAPG
jgi:hypothetical protein